MTRQEDAASTQEAAQLRRALEDAYRLIHNCLLVLPEGAFKADVAAWLSEQLGLGSIKAHEEGRSHGDHEDGAVPVHL